MYVFELINIFFNWAAEFFRRGGGEIALLFEIFLLRRDVVMFAGFER